MSDFERIRYERLNQVMKKAVEQTIKKLLMSEQLEKCFPTISTMKGGPEALETARKQIQKYFHSTCVKQFDHIFETRDIKRKLDELDEIIHDGQKRRDSGTEKPLHVDQLSATQLIGAATSISRKDAIKKLQLIYDQLVLDNQQLYDELKQLANESESLRTDINTLVNDLSSGIDELKRQDFDSRLDALSKEVFQS